MIHLVKEYQGNFEAQEVIRLISYTNKSLFLTGKAGTGKSYLLRKLTEHTHKKFVILASTGVAALNVGGQTIHSFLRIEPRPYLPNDKEIQELSDEKKELLRNLDLIIIDEVSMVRSDLMQAVDLSLRKNLKSPYPFAGKQLLLIGDLFQLPPVVSNKNLGEKEIIDHNYQTPYFFSSQSLENGYNYHVVELQKVYRQTDADFISVLNAVRTSNVSTGHLQVINKRHIPGYEPADGSFEITLCTRNDIADDLNKSKLDSLKGMTKTFRAIMTGDFLKEKGANKLPADSELYLKPDAQVMFIKNDQSRRWVNGSIGKIVSINADTLRIKVDVTDEVHVVERTLWEHIEYKWNKEEEKIEKIVTGTFQQFPIKLAWAVTIHKSQGQTYQNAIIDMGSGAFAPGQTYVALSRCTTLNGIKLKRPITLRDIITDSRIGTYLQNKITPSMEKERYEAVLNGVQERLAAIEQENTRLKIRVTEAEKSKNDLQKKMEQALSNIQARDREITNNKQEIAKLKKELATAKSASGNLRVWIFLLVAAIGVLGYLLLKQYSS